MREFWKKTSLLYKLIAVILTIVMVGTTLYFHFDRKYSAKAMTDGTYTWGKLYLPDGNDANVFGQGGWLIADDNKQFSDTCKVRFYVSVDSESILDSVYIKHNVGSVDGTPDNLKNYYTNVTNNYGTSKIYYVSPDTYVYGTANIKDKFFIDAACGDEDFVFDIMVTSSDFAVPELSVTAKIGEIDLNGGTFDTLGKNSTMTINVSSPKIIATFTVFGKAASLGEPVFDTQTQLYEYPAYTYNFTTENEEITKVFDNKSVVVGYGDVEGTTQKTLTATSLKYDGKPPAVTVKIDGNDVDPEKWYTTNTIKITATDNDTKLKNFNISIRDNNSTTNQDNENINGAEVSKEKEKTLSPGNNFITIEAEDMAGNKTTIPEFVVKVDNTNPTISSLVVEGKNSDGFVKLSDSGDVKINGSASDDYSGVAKINVKATKDSTNIEKDIEINPVEAGACNFEFNLSDVLGTGLSNHSCDGSWTLNVNPIDSVGKSATPMTNTFTLDTKKPVIEKKALQKWDGTQWIDVSDEELLAGTFYVNKTEYPNVRFKLSLEEINIPDSNPIRVYDGESEFNNCSVYQDGGFYYVEVASENLSKETALSLSPKCIDKAGNESDTVALTPLRLVDSVIKVNLTELKIGENTINQDNVENISDLILNKNVKDQVILKLVVKSGFNITEVKLNGTDSVQSATLTSKTPDGSGIYTTDEITFVIPAADLDKNAQFSSLSLYVKDANNQEKNIPVGDLLYDVTNPEVTIKNSDYNSSKWYQEYKLKYDLVSGTSVIESDLNTASYTINGTVNTIAVTGTKIEDAETVDIAESTSVAGTTVTFNAQDKATNSLIGGEFIVKVDKTAPSVSEVKVNGEDASADTVLAGTPQLASTVTDNLTINNYHVSVLYNGAAYADYPVLVQKDETSESINYTLQQLLGDKTLNDGRYDVSVIAWDKSGRDSNVSSTAFVVDNTAPVVTADIVGGTSGKSNSFYNTDVTVRLTCKDNNFDRTAMVVTDNGSAVNADWKVGTDVYYADIVLSSEGMHNIIVSGNDKAGNAAVPKQATFTIDKTTPAVTLLVNGGQVYNESRGTLNLTGPLALSVSVTDTNEDVGDLKIQVIKTIPDTATTTSDYMSTGDRTFTFADEADYTINIFAVDKANNQGPTRTISFRVDSTAPQLTITGANGGISASATTVSFNLNEAFWSDAKGTVEIYRKAGDGVDEVLFKTLTLTPTQKNYSLSEVLTETGIYRFEFNANDKVGHTATTSQKVTVDRNKPEITLTGVNNYDSTDGEVSISAVIKDEFYANKKVSISGTRIDADGKKTAVSFSPFAATANPTTISDTFKEEGIYDITITSTDIAGNVSTSSVHFTIDTSKPNIGDLSDFDGKTFNKKTFNELNLDELELDNLVSDLTVCQIRMYLNGSEYDGIDEIEDGSYTLLITAEDELGHKSEKTATFVIDTKDPVFIVTGVEDGEVKNEDYNIEVSLQLDEDELEQVTLNGKDITFENNEASLNVTEKGEYELYMKAKDDAGNETEQTITFTFGEESVASAVSDAVEKAASHWWMWAVLAAAILAVGGFIFIILKRRKED